MAGPFLMICAEVGVDGAVGLLDGLVVASGHLVLVADGRADPVTLGYILVCVGVLFQSCVF